MKGSVFCSAKARLKLEEGVGEVLGEEGRCSSASGGAWAWRRAGRVP